MLLDIAFQWTNTFVESLNEEFKTPWKIVFNENWRIDRLPQRFMGGVTWVGCVPASSLGGGWCVRRCPPWSSGTWGGAAWGQQGGGCSDAEISENKLVEQAELAVIVKRKRLHSKQNNQALCTLKHIQLKIYTEWLIEDFNILWRGNIKYRHSQKTNSTNDAYMHTWNRIIKWYYFLQNIMITKNPNNIIRNQKYTLYSELHQPLMFEMHSKFTLYIYKMYIFIK